MIALEKRPQPSRVWSVATPVIAVLATMVFGGILFAMLGKSPVEAIRTIFWEPLFGEFSFYYRPQLLVKGAPLVLIAIGLSLGFRAGIWNIGAEGQYIMGAIVGAGSGQASGTSGLKGSISSVRSAARRSGWRFILPTCGSSSR